MSIWPQTRIRYVADLNPPIRPDLLANLEAELSFLPMEAIGEDGSLNLDRTRPIGEVRNGYTYFEDGDVAFAKVTPCFENGKGALMRQLAGGAGFGTTELTVLRPKPGSNARFLNYVFHSERFRQLGMGAMTGAGGLKRVPDDFTRNFSTVWPTPPEQERIANFLDAQTARIDALIAEKGLLLERLREYHRSLVWSLATKGLSTESQLVSARSEWIGQVPSHWSVKKIKWITPVLRGASPRPIDDPKYFDENGDYAWVRIADVSASNGVLTSTLQRLSELGASLSVKREPGAMFLSIAGTVGKPCIAGIKCCIHDGFVWFPAISKDTIRDWLFNIFEAGLPYAGLGKMGTQLNLNTDTVGNIDIPMPPDAELVEILNAMSKAKSANYLLQQHALKHIALLREYRSSLISATVTGQLEIDKFKMAP